MKCQFTHNILGLDSFLPLAPQWRSPQPGGSASPKVPVWESHNLLSSEGQAGHIPQLLRGLVSLRLTPALSSQSSHIEGPARGATPLWGLSVFTEESQSLPHPVWGAQGWRVTTLSVYNDLILSDLIFGCLMQSSKQVTSTVTKKEGTIPQP